MLSFDFNHFIAQNPTIKDKLDNFTDILLTWNPIHNLTGAKDRESIAQHIHDSLIPTTFLQPFQTCIDIGSGAGFPAIILACCYPNSFFYLLEPRIKRVSFLENAIIKLHIQNIEIINDFSYNIHHLQAELITSRAVCASWQLIQASKHLLKKNGFYLLFKGTKSISEANDLEGFDTQILHFHQRIFIYAQEQSLLTQ